MKKPGGKTALSAEFERESEQGTRRCTLYEYLGSRTEEERRDTYDALMNKLDIPVAAIQRVLQQRGWQHQYNVLKTHRKDGCRRCGIKPPRRPD